MDASAAREVANTFLLSSMDVVILTAALLISFASIFIVTASLRRLKRLSALLTGAQGLQPQPSHSRDLDRALVEGQLELVFQPQGSFGSLEVTVAEALLRWRLPDGQYRSPNDFLGAAEQSTLITEIDAWVLKRAISTAARWHRGCWPGVRVAVNVSPRQLLDDSFVDRVGRLLKDAGVPPCCLEIELTENVLQTTPSTVAALNRLRALGVSVALDDFGTGYSSLTSLEQLPLTRVKIDRSLVSNLDTSSRSAAIVRAIIALCQNLGLHVTAEGVERPAQLARLLGSSEVDVQGYLLARPLSEADFEQFLTRHNGHMQELLLQSFEHVQPDQHDALRFAHAPRAVESVP
jgi:EAL domain-containing protein (putative c-di-GMP-specific phosphodiesterase class I)